VHSQSIFETGAHKQRISSVSSAYVLHATERKPYGEDTPSERSTTNIPIDRLQQHEPHGDRNPDKQELQRNDWPAEKEPQNNAWPAEKEPQNNAWLAEKEPQNNAWPSANESKDNATSEEEGENMFQDLQELFGDLYLAPGLRLSDLHGQGRDEHDGRFGEHTYGDGDVDRTGEGVDLYDGEDWVDTERNTSESRGGVYIEDNSADGDDDYDGDNDGVDENFDGDGDGDGIMNTGTLYNDNVYQSHDSDYYGNHGAASLDGNNENYFGANYFKNHYEQGYANGIPARRGMGGTVDGKARVVARQYPLPRVHAGERGGGVTRQTTRSHGSSATKRGRSKGRKRGRWSTTSGRRKGKKVFRWGR
jgi:hypothetical protein